MEDERTPPDAWGSRGRRFESCRPDGMSGRFPSMGEPPVSRVSCGYRPPGRSTADLQVILVRVVAHDAHAFLEHIWSTASEPVKWGRGLLQTPGPVGDGR